MTVARYPIAYSRLMRALGGALGLGPRGSRVEVGEAEVDVRMGWGFRARFPREAVKSAEPSRQLYISQGIHGRKGRWLVNGSPRGVVRIELAGDHRARVLGRQVRLSVLEVSVEDPDALVAALVAPSGQP
jgi:hypothetical protein